MISLGDSSLIVGLVELGAEIKSLKNEILKLKNFFDIWLQFEGGFMFQLLGIPKHPGVLLVVGRDHELA